MSKKRYRLEACPLYEECYHLKPLEESLLPRGQLTYLGAVYALGDVQLYVTQLSLDMSDHDGVEGCEREDGRLEASPTKE